jgi:hypothetical protein
MRLPSPRQANAFFAPLKHKTTTFVVEGREVNLQFAQLILNLASSLKWRVLVLDTDAFYAANIILVSEKQPDFQKRGVFIRIPTKDSKLEDWLVDSLFARCELLILDDLNTLHHLLSALEAKSGSRKLHFIERTLSYLARLDNKTVILTLYKSVMDSTTHGESTRSLSKQSDLVVSVELQDSFVRFTCEEERAWAGNLFSVRI